MPPSLLGRMQACSWPSFDSRRGKFAGTITVPCLVVTTMAEGAAYAGGIRAFAVKASAGLISTFSTGAQSIPEQHSIGYQSWAFARCASVIKPANTARVAMTIRVTSWPQL